MKFRFIAATEYLAGGSRYLKSDMGKIKLMKEFQVQALQALINRHIDTSAQPVSVGSWGQNSKVLAAVSPKLPDVSR